MSQTYENIFNTFFNLVRTDILPMKSMILPMLSTGSYNIPHETSAEKLFLALYNMNQPSRRDDIHILIPRFTKKDTPFIIEFYYQTIHAIANNMPTNPSTIFEFFNDKMLRIWVYFYDVFKRHEHPNEYKNQIRQRVSVLRNWVQIHAADCDRADLRQFALFLFCYMYGHTIIRNFMSSKNYRITNDIKFDIQTNIEHKEMKTSISGFIAST